ncbi:MAG: glycosyltransferase family 4 protein [Planctomycetaceae bacterium]|nr:glycosyltransferase family 4 protein [Planctomycetaceae bacterium]
MSRPIRTLMLGWEFPPQISGGLGTACYGLTKAMDRLGMEVVFMLPQSSPLRFGHSGPEWSMKDLEHQAEAFEHVRFLRVAANLRPYLSAPTQRSVKGESGTLMMTESGPEHTESGSLMGGYPSDLFRSVQDYARKASCLARKERFDVIHAHDWMTYPAALAAARASGKPVVVHVHSTEFDRSGEHVNDDICRVEYTGIRRAQKVIAVSHYTKRKICDHYRIPAEKIEVVYNGVEQDFSHPVKAPARRYADQQYVLFLGRITMQKGPEYFLHAARMVIDKRDDIRFIMAGAGDMLHRMVELAARLRIGSKVLFTKFLHGPDVERAYRLADLYVMPSVSEPFGIAPLEAIRCNVPVLISRQSGVSEVLKHAIKVDFWDIHQIANKIVNILSRPAMSDMLKREGRIEMTKLRWETSARHIGELYKRMMIES